MRFPSVLDSFLVEKAQRTCLESLKINFGGDKMNLLSNQIFFFFFDVTCGELQGAAVFNQVLPKAWSQVKTSFPSRKAFTASFFVQLLMWKIPFSSDKTASAAPSALISIASAGLVVTSCSSSLFVFFSDLFKGSLQAVTQDLIGEERLKNTSSLELGKADVQEFKVPSYR